MQDLTPIPYELILGEKIYSKTVFILLPLLFFCVIWMEAKTGATPGKYLCRLSVVGPQAQVPGWKRSFIRNAIKIVELNPFLLCGLPSGIYAWMSPTKQRIGDRLAGTYVVRMKDLSVPGREANGLEGTIG